MRRAGIALCAAILAAAEPAVAEPYGPDSVLPALELPDQDGDPHALDESLRALVYSRDMAAGDLVKQAVLAAGPTLFERNHSVYVVDLAGMSALVRRWFALPALRRRPYRLLVDAEGAKTADFPAAEGRPTVLLLDRLRVSRVLEPASADELILLLEAAAR